MKAPSDHPRPARRLQAALLAFALPLLPAPLPADPIEVSNTAGQKMTIEVLSYTASSGNVRIRRADGQIFNAKIDVFDPASRELIIANAPKETAKFSMDVSIGKKRKDKANSTYMENMTVTTSVKVANPSRDIDLGETRFTILLVGRNSKRYADRAQDWYKILSVQQFSTQLPSGKSSQHELKPIETSYDSDKDHSNVGGWEFEGYLLVAQDADGAILATKTSLGPVSTTALKEEKLIRDALLLREGTETNHDLTPRGSR